jgi:GTPase SAR1 family protein
MWDCGGGDKIRPLFKHYFENIDVFIHVIDSTDRDRLEESIYWLDSWLSDKSLENIFVIVFANKQDLESKMDVGEISTEISKKSLKQNYIILPCSALTGQGLFEGMEVIDDYLTNRKK